MSGIPMRVANECCGKCMYSNEMGTWLRQCRRHAPIAKGVPVDSMVRDPIWPMVRPDDWCGDYYTDTVIGSDWAEPGSALLTP